MDNAAVNINVVGLAPEFEPQGLGPEAHPEQLVPSTPSPAKFSTLKLSSATKPESTAPISPPPGPSTEDVPTWRRALSRVLARLMHSLRAPGLH